MKNEEKIAYLLANLPDTDITYIAKPSSSMNVPYKLTVKAYKKMYLNEKELFDLTPQEQLILLHSSNQDPTYTPSTTVAGIFKAREILKRSKTPEEAIDKCNLALIDLNKKTFSRRSVLSETVSRKRIHANLLDYYLRVEKESQEYLEKQNSPLAPLRRLKNSILSKITGKPHGKPPFSQDEIQRGRAEWENFRIEQGAKKGQSNRDLLEKYRYNGEFHKTEPFAFIYYTDHELSAIEEEYSTANIALQILDGSSYERAVQSINETAIHKETSKTR